MSKLILFLSIGLCVVNNDNIFAAAKHIKGKEKKYGQKYAAPVYPAPPSSGARAENKDTSDSSSSSSTLSSSTAQKRLINNENLANDITHQRLSNIRKTLNNTNVNDFIKYCFRFETPLSLAVHTCIKPEIVEEIVKMGADVNQIIDKGRTPLVILLEREIHIRDPRKVKKNYDEYLSIIHQMAKILWSAGSDRFIGKVHLQPDL